MRVVVWFVDDEDVVRTAAARYLAAVGFEVVALPDAYSALRRLERGERPDILVTDLGLGPGQPHGVALASMARRRSPSLPVLFVTGRRDYDPGELASLGALLEKPFDMPALVAAVQATLRANGAEIPPTRC